jgi:HK97 family phage portal protein
MWPFRKQVEQRATFQVGETGWGRGTFSGISVSPDTAMRLGAVFACVRILADTISTLPYRCFDSETLRPVPAPGLVVAPAAFTKWHSWIAQIMRSVLTAGDTYGLIAARSGAALQPSQIELVHPDRVGVQFATDRITRVYRFDGREVARGDELWRFPGYEMPGYPSGLSPIRYAAETIGLGIAAQRYGATFFGNGARPVGVAMLPKEIGVSEFNEFVEKFKESHQGVDNANKTLFLGGGGQWEKVSVSPDEAQFLETQQLNTAQICAIYGVPVEMVGQVVPGGSSVTYQNVEQRPMDLLKFGVGPWIARLQAEIDDLLPGTIVGRFDPAGLLKADFKTRSEAYAVALESGWLTLPEIRALEELPPLPAGTTAPRLEAVS